MPTATQAPQSGIGPLPPTQATSIGIHHPTSESSPRIKRTEPLIGKLVWLIVAALLAVPAGSAVQTLVSWYNRPRLETWYSISALLTTTITDGDWYNNHALYVDRINNCAIVGYDAAVKSENLERWGSTSEAFYKVLVRNSGRSPVTDIKFSLEDNDGSDSNAEVETTPSLAVDITRTISTTGIRSVVVSIRDLPPHVIGVVTFRRKTDDDSLTVHEVTGVPSQYTVNYKSSPTRLQFHGSKELGASGGFSPIGAIEMLWRESQIYGFENLQVPFVADAAAYANKGDTVSFKPKVVFPYQAANNCPFPLDSPRQFAISMPVRLKSDGSKSLEIQKAGVPR